MASSRNAPTATLLLDGRVLIAGGSDSSNGHFEGPALASAELYDPTTGTFSATGSMGTARTEQSATLLADGRVLIAGGQNGMGSSVFSSAELYDPSAGVFSPTGKMTSPRGSHSATLLPDGRVLIAGGHNGSADVASSELYNLKTGTFARSGSMTTVRDCQVATLLSDGRVLIIGGGTPAGPLASAELYDPRSGSFGKTGSMAYARIFATATLLNDGRVLVAGGDPDAAAVNPAASAELYDPATGGFQANGLMTTARMWHTATLLSDGCVLITGGDNPRTLASAELYTP
jgi:hypothetical protein